VSERLKESLSAVMDGEADEFELRRVLDELDRNPQLQDAWDRYHVIGAQIRGEQAPAQLLNPGELTGMADTVWETLGLEAAQADDPAGDWQAPVAANSGTGPALVTSGGVGEPTQRRGLTAMTGMAVAASVALMVTVGFFALQTQEPTVEVAEAVAPLQIEQPVVIEVTAPAAADLQRANAYMLHHVQHTALNKAGVASFVKVVTFDKAKD